MADIRIKDLATTATTTASDDFMAVDGVTNGTRKLSAAAPSFLTSVTTPSLTSPAATNLTLAGGSSGASLVLGQGTNGSATITTTGAGVTQITSALLVGQQAAIGASLDVQTASGTAATLRLFQSGVSNWVFSVPSATDALVLSQYGTNEAFRISNNRNVLIGTTSETGLTGAGGLKIGSTTAGSSGAGALVVAGGLATGAASYFGGAVQITGNVTLGQAASGSGPQLYLQADASVQTRKLIIYDTSATNNTQGVEFSNVSLGTSGSAAYMRAIRTSSGGSNTDLAFGTMLSGTVGEVLRLASTGAATFAGAVSYAGSLKEGSDNVISSSGTALLFGNSGTWTETRIGSTNASGIVTLYAGNAERMRIASTGAITMNAYGAGAATFDSSGNITSVSDARLKNITGTFTKGLAEIVKLTPKLYTWKPETGLVTDDINATLIAQDLIAAGLTEAVSTYRTVPVMEDDVQSAEDIAAGKPVTQHAKLDADGKAVTQRVDSNYSVSDRTVIAALVNAVKELKAEIDALKAK